MFVELIVVALDIESWVMAVIVCIEGSPVGIALVAQVKVAIEGTSVEQGLNGVDIVVLHIVLRKGSGKIVAGADGLEVSCDS